MCETIKTYTVSVYVFVVVRKNEIMYVNYDQKESQGSEKMKIHKKAF